MSSNIKLFGLRFFGTEVDVDQMQESLRAVESIKSPKAGVVYPLDKFSELILN